MSQFVHLHLHTQYSVLDGAIKIYDCVNRAKELGQPAVAMTDHGVMHGAIEFYNAARSVGVKPIIGCEVYVASNSRHDRKPRNQGGSRTHHLTLLAQNLEGYRNLCRLVSLGFWEGFYSKPRVDLEILKQFNSGIIAFSGCMAGQFASYSPLDDIEGAQQFAEQYASVFRDRFYLEIQPHTHAEQQKLNRLAREVGKRSGIPLIATNDCHYLSPDDHYAQEVLMCVSMGKTVDDPDRIQHTEARLHLKTYDEMISELPEDEEAIRNSVSIAERCNVEFDFSTYHMPQFQPPAERTIDEHFEAEARDGLERRIKKWGALDRTLTADERKAYNDRLDEEIQLIKRMGFAGYFLVVSDFIRWAKEHEIPVGPGRGSAAGSLVAYAMDITEVDPIPHKLLFERFLNPDRVSLPDIDIDFCIHGRQRVIEYVCEKYGRDKVAQICTFGTLKAKAVVKDVGRALGMPYGETDRIAKLIPAPRQGFDYALAEAIAMEKRLKEYSETEDGKRLISIAMKLEGLSRHTSTHPAGIVIADKPVVEYMPLMVDREEQVVAQFSMNYVEKIGLVKFDFLGLKTLTVISEAVRMIKEATGKSIDVNALPLSDTKTYRLISSGRCIGVFQLESSGITDMVTRLKPNSFDDLVAILALYRPGPLDAGMVDHYINRKHGREPVKYLHPLLEPILSDTYGIILYQEQIMQIARDMAGYSLGEADLLRRAMGKKKPEEMAKQRDIFIQGAIKRGVKEKIATEVFDQMETFARYGFNRSHSAAYAMVSYQTAYLKTHYPRFFLAALMTLEMGDTDRTLKNLNEASHFKINVLPPDVNTGEVGFKVVDNKIVFGLAAIKGIGEKAVEKILEERKRGGEFKGLLDFCLRVDQSVLNRRLIENFIQAGAFDWTKLTRAELLHRLEDIQKLAERTLKDRQSNQISLFGAEEKVDESSYRPNRKLLPEWPVNVKLAKEKQALGFYLSGHPLEKFQKELERLGSQTIEQLSTRTDGSDVKVAGVITFCRLKNTKKGDRYATFVLEDMLNTIEVIVWPDTYLKVHSVLTSEDPVLVSGRLDISDERRTIVANSIESAIALRDSSAREALVQVETKFATPERWESLKRIFVAHSGDCPVKIVIRDPKRSETILQLPPELSVAPSESLCNQVEELFGFPVMSFR